MSSLYLSTEIINKENYKETLFKLLDCIDADFTGTNGDEYTWDFALEKGFKSNLDYSIHEALSKYDSLEDIINHVLTDAKGSWSGYYNNTEIHTKEINNQFVVSVAVSCR